MRGGQGEERSEGERREEREERREERGREEKMRFSTVTRFVPADEEHKLYKTHPTLPPHLPLSLTL